MNTVASTTFIMDCEKFHHVPLLTIVPSSGHDIKSLKYTTVLVLAELIVKPSKVPNAGLGVLKIHSLYIVYYLGNELYVWYVEKYAKELVISSSFKGREIPNSCP